MPVNNEKTDNNAADDDPSDLEWSDEEGTTVEGIYIPPAAQPPVLDKTQSRLIITHITINFFKSFAEQQILGPFHKRFNAIVGPNGNGKSNVIDALLFVFGYRATKIRSKKLSVLLHSSEYYQNVASCKVSIHFCVINDKEGDDYEVVPGSEFMISRIANKDNSSFYELNQKRVQFKEVAQLLKQHGIDLIYNRFLILQGEVEEIAMMKCKGASENETGMLEYLEDVIGTTRYKKPLEQLSEKIEILSEQAFEKLNRMKLAEKELDNLKEPMQEAVNFLKSENDIMVLKNFLYQKQIAALDGNIKEVEEEKSEIDSKHNKLMEELNKITNTKKEKEGELKKVSSEYDQLQKRHDKIKEAFNNAEKKDVELQATMQQVETNRKTWIDKLAAEKKKLVQLEQVPEKNAAAIEVLEIKEKDLVDDLEEIENEKTAVLSTIRSETQELQAEKENLEKELAPLLEAAGAKKSELNMAESELKIFRSNEENEKNKYEKLQQTYQETIENINLKTNEIKELKSKIPVTQKQLDNARQKFDNNRSSEGELVANLNKKRVSLEEKRSSMQASRSRGRVLDALMQQKREGKCNGIYGRLGDLGAIDMKYDVAVSTACGRLDNIVVDTVTTAEWCIQFLRKHDIGRATFIALHEQEHLRQLATTKITTPENVHRLYDLIKVENEEFKTAFYFSLRDTLVADDINQATRIAYGARRYRVVTLKGDIIETSGTMSGGGRTVMRGKMGQKVVQSEIDPKLIENLTVELNDIEQTVRDLRREQNELENQINTLEPELRRMMIDLEKCTTNIKGLQQLEERLKSELKQQEKSYKTTKADPAVVKKLTAAVETKQTAYEKSAAIAQKLQDRVDKLSANIKEKTTGKIQSIDKKLREKRNELDKMKSEIIKLNVAIKTSARNAKNCKDKITNFEKDIENAEKRLEEMKKEREEIETDGQKLIQFMEELSEKIKEGEKDYAELKQDVKLITEEENRLKSRKVDIDASILTFTKKLNECNEHIHRWHAKLQQLKLHDIPFETVEPLKKLNEEELETKTIKTLELELNTAENLIKDAKPNLQVIQEYNTCHDKYQKRFEEFEVINSKLQEIKNVTEKVRNQRKDEFLVGFNVIRLKLQEMYQMITLGGNADLECVDSFNPFAEGIQFNVRPPKKSWKKISNLSGGEKTLSSLALVFALHYYKPSPLYVMDEIDAALDFKNVSIVGHYIKEGTKNAQFIIISLRTEMFELADQLNGIYKTFNSTKVVVIDPRGYVRKPEEPPAIATQPNQEEEQQEEQMEVEDIDT